MSPAREGRGVWIVLSLLMAALLAGLLLEGVIATTAGPNRVTAPAAGRPVAVGGGGSALRLGPGGRLEAVRVPPRTVALSFDGGPDPRVTPHVLRILAAAQVPATFFVEGTTALRSPGLVAAEGRQGDEVGVLASASPGLDLRLSELALAGALGESSALVRLPTSAPDEVNVSELGAAQRLAASGYRVVLFDRDAAPTGRTSAADLERAALAPAPDGAIVRLTTSGPDAVATLAALPRIIARYRAEHYRFVTVSAALGSAPLAGLSPTSWIHRLEGKALGFALLLASGFVSLLSWLVLAFAALSLLRLGVMVGFARRHVRRFRHARRPRVLPFPRADTGLGTGGPPAVTVLVPAYNEAVGIEAAIRSLLASDYPNLEVLVIDDGSTDGTAELVEGLGLDRVRVLRKENGGKARALTTGVAACDAEIVVMVDGDTIFEPEALSRLVGPLADPRVGAVSGNTKVGNRRGLIGRWQHLEYVSAFNLERRLYDLWHCMPTVPGAIGAFRRRALLDVGGVSDDTLAEDTDLTMALHRAGWLVVYQDDARAWTEAPQTLSQLWRQRYRWCYGTLQATWKHRRALAEPHSGLGRVGIPSLLVFQVLLPLIGPAIDLYALYGLLFRNPLTTGLIWVALVGIQALTTAYALVLDQERLGPLWALPLQQFVYRQLMYLVVIRSVVSALAGVRLRWQKLPRSGELVAPRGGAGQGGRLPEPALVASVQVPLERAGGPAAR